MSAAGKMFVGEGTGPVERVTQEDSEKVVHNGHTTPMKRIWRGERRRRNYHHSHCHQHLLFQVLADFFLSYRCLLFASSI